LDLSIVQGPFSITKCQILTSRFAPFSSLYGEGAAARRSEDQGDRASAAGLPSNAVHGVPGTTSTPAAGLTRPGVTSSVAGLRAAAATVLRWALRRHPDAGVVSLRLPVVVRAGVSTQSLGAGLAPVWTCVRMGVWALSAAAAAFSGSRRHVGTPAVGVVWVAGAGLGWGSWAGGPGRERHHGRAGWQVGAGVSPVEVRSAAALGGGGE
jgi:hypothetical protein